MKVSPEQRFELFRSVLAALAPQRIAKCPPARDGTMKPANVPFATACWAESFTRAAVYVLEQEDKPQKGGREPEEVTTPGSSAWT